MSEAPYWVNELLDDWQQALPQMGHYSLTMEHTAPDGTVTRLAVPLLDVSGTGMFATGIAETMYEPIDSLGPIARRAPTGEKRLRVLLDALLVPTGDGGDLFSITTFAPGAPTNTPE